MNAVEFEQVSKSYSIYDAPSGRLQELLTLNRVQRHRDFWALRDISFEVKRGETFCVVGENGSGKSTLLQIVAGILQPSSGRAAINGRVSALLELGAGFNPEFSGRDNVYLNASILGFNKRQIDSRYRDIENFAEIGEFINQPVKTYSSGMAVRLAFAVAIHVDPEVLLVDEALAVGDIYFRQRCMRKVHELRGRGVTVLFVSHATADVKALGDRVMWLDHGRVVEVGQPDGVISRYLAAMSAKDSSYRRHEVETHIGGASRAPLRAPEVVETIPNIDGRHGDGRAKIIGIAVLDENGFPLHMLEPSSRILVRISVRAEASLRMPNVGFMLRNQLGIDFAGVNSAREGYEIEPLQAGDVITVDFYLDLPELYPASFSFSPAVADGPLDAYSMCDWIDNAVTLQMSRSEGEIYGYMHLPCRIEVNAPALEKTVG
ncbi:MAG TPA: ABC transporter ATP-binding protein [Bryobacteraceae bacterium]|nr:ABC transporter ATP-binding protein [Bryobacteraceae bacterium]